MSSFFDNDLFNTIKRICTESGLNNVWESLCSGINGLASFCSSSYNKLLSSEMTGIDFGAWLSSMPQWFGARTAVNAYPPVAPPAQSATYVPPAPSRRPNY